MEREQPRGIIGKMRVHKRLIDLDADERGPAAAHANPGSQERKY